ncbi:tripartite motif-containing protein 65-like [Myripristis murdjan]|uniref:tripartite motif-containing protein 65-like n=1 Tax=Myripristis murdjan TaxID=586833 RepID=UPI001175DF47|nr:tripartite motif-containing protein 65-like [Myripristis murdjan]
MAQRGIQLDSAKFCCSICLDLLKDPVTIPCGHSYCMSCIKDCWDGEEHKEIHSCPQCRQTFTPRPVLVKSAMLAALVQEVRKTGLGDGDLQENICSRHNEVMKIFCRTDQQFICYLCSMDEHKGHDTVSAAAECTEKQSELRVRRQKIQQRIQDREKNVKVLRQEMQAINRIADEAVGSSKKVFTELVCLIEKRKSDMKQQIRSEQKEEVRRIEELQEKLRQEVVDLRREDAELEQLSHTEDHNHFLHSYPSLSRLSESAESPSADIHPLRYFEDVTAAVSQLRDKLQDILSEEWSKSSLTVTGVGDVLLTPGEPKTRAELLQHSRQLTLDPNTAHVWLSLSEGNRKVTLEVLTLEEERLGLSSSFFSTNKFFGASQVLSREGLTGRCYWEVERKGRRISIAVAYKNISRTGSECVFGCNDKSWALDCFDDCYQFSHSNIATPISGPQSSRIGVYLDHSAGILSFYSVSETMTLLHRVQTTFTQPLYAGIWLWTHPGATAELCKLN